LNASNDEQRTIWLIAAKMAALRVRVAAGCIRNVLAN
jgi:hypothetical protein